MRNLGVSCARWRVIIKLLGTESYRGKAKKFLCLPGRISPIMSHGIGPKPNEKAMTKTTKLTSGSQP